ncbi:MAG: glycosyltransferase family 4 protein [Bacilli bacterium]|nr:glycosyltransferase family 4 protein [Bacilli bacterium]
MKALIYLQDRKKLQHSGIGRALEHQQRALNSAGVQTTFDPSDKYDLVHLNSYQPGTYRFMKKCLKKGIPVIVHGHSTHEDFADSFRCWKLVHPIYNHWMNRMYKRADLIITPTPYSKGLIENYKGVTCPVKAISNGIDINDYSYKQEQVDNFVKMFNIKEDEKVVIGVGFPFKRKGLDDFIEVARKMPDVKFIWFGYLQKILTSHYMLKVMKHKPSNVILPGYIKGDIIHGAYHRANCMFFPTREETEGIVALESLACKCPLVTRDIGVYKGWLENEKNCLMGKTNEEFISQIKRTFTEDLNNIKQEGYKVAQERDLPIVGEQLEKAYRELLETKNI